MDDTLDLVTVADAVLAAHAVIEENGTHEMKMMSRTLLFTVGKEIAQRGGLSCEPTDLHHAEPGWPLEQSKVER
ncbi:hypothetical protein [Methylobacterium sp. WL6]|uniref:hypothetical protein n=1 Tax=Methylobacterium sp. WL6 TaxID=2603901 RepID=UPI0011C74B21|nr:hypothetical protein [Methylobacterium sp. WL6]TXN71888.1 hypothetical protein FV230_06810 [Methylobacterium sp. WL6]